MENFQKNLNWLNIYLAQQTQRYTLIDDVLYFIDPDPPNRLRLTVPQSYKQKLLEESHAGSLVVILPKEDC